MIADQDVVITSHGRLNVRVDRAARFYRGVVALVDGEGTLERPLHFVLLTCHADMADESPIALTERFTNTLAQEMLARMRDEQGDVSDAIRASNAAAAATDRYYSTVVGRLMERSLSIASLGRVEAVVLTPDARTQIITPNVLRIGGHAILNGTFGIGFKEEAVSAARVQLDRDSALLLVVGGEAAAIDTTRDSDGQSFIEEVIRSARISPPVVAVVR